MKIQSINNTNFKGLFTDKTRSNNGEWRMEYQPYSWEMKNEKEFGMAPQDFFYPTNIDIPDNEKIYTDGSRYNTYGHQIGRKSCKDLLGTEFYYEDYDLNKTRNRITEMPAMSLEDSLRVKDRKLEAFLKLQADKKAEYLKDFEEKYDSAKKHKSEFYDAYFDYRSKVFPGSHHVEKMEDKVSSMGRDIDSMKDYIGYYFDIENSQEAVKALKAKGLEKIAELEEARKSGKLIDISRRFKIFDPNKILWDALQNIKTASGKLIALPHKTITVNELLKLIGNNVKTSEIADKGIKIIDQMIRTRV